MKVSSKNAQVTLRILLAKGLAVEGNEASDREEEKESRVLCSPEKSGGRASGGGLAHCCLLHVPL